MRTIDKRSCQCRSCSDGPSDGVRFEYPTCKGCGSNGAIKFMKETSISPGRPVCQNCTKGNKKEVGKQVGIGTHKTAGIQGPWEWLITLNY
jgi:hypothetical protein